MSDSRDVIDQGGHVNQNAVVLQMLVDDVRQIRTTQQEQAIEARDEMRRLSAKLDAFRDEVHDSLMGHDRDIVRLTTQASMAGRVSGFFAGSIAGVITAVIIDLARHTLFGG